MTHAQLDLVRALVPSGWQIGGRVFVVVAFFIADHLMHPPAHIVPSEDRRLVAVRAAVEPLLEVRGDLARLAWHIGNRHAPARIEADRLLVRRDRVMAQMLEGLGAALAEIDGPFVPEGGATICDHRLPGGTIVSMSAPVTQIDPAVFGADAESFRPERWLEASPEQLKAMDRSFLAVSHNIPRLIL